MQPLTSDAHEAVGEDGQVNGVKLCTHHAGHLGPHRYADVPSLSHLCLAAWLHQDGTGGKGAEGLEEVQEEGRFTLRKDMTRPVMMLMNFTKPPWSWCSITYVRWEWPVALMRSSHLRVYPADGEDYSSEASPTSVSAWLFPITS